MRVEPAIAAGLSKLNSEMFVEVDVDLGEPGVRTEEDLPSTGRVATSGNRHWDP